MSNLGVGTPSDAVREPANRAYASLSEALTWIAYGCALDYHAFSSMRASRTGIFGDIAASEEKLRNAIRQFSDRAGGGFIKARGRYTKAHSRGDDFSYADTVEIPATTLRDYALFDIGNGGLRRGSGLSIDEDYQSLEGTFARLSARADDEGYHPDDGYYGVEVHRDDLMREFPDPPASTRAAFGDVVSWCLDWQNSQPGKGMDAAWRDFRVIPRFKGMSRDDVLRPAFKKAKI